MRRYSPPNGWTKTMVGHRSTYGNYSLGINIKRDGGGGWMIVRNFHDTGERRRTAKDAIIWCEMKYKPIASS